MIARLAHVLLLILALCSGAWAQDGVTPAPVTEGAPKTLGTGGTTKTFTVVRTPTVDYDGWDAVAGRAEETTANAATTVEQLDKLRAELVDWRARLAEAQNTNAARIETLGAQITALGAPPEEGVLEEPEIAARRAALEAQMKRLQAPGIAAGEAYRRADGLIAEIDRVMRARQANELLKLWPAPLNPANWPAGLGALRDMAVTLFNQTNMALRWPSSRKVLWDNLPLIVLYLVAAIALLWRGRGWIDGVIRRLQNRTSVRAQRLWEMLASLGQIIIPALAEALGISGMIGPLGRDIVEALPRMVFTLFAAIWLGGRLFPHGTGEGAILALTTDRRAEGRVLATSFGLVLTIEILRRVAMTRLGSDEAAVAVLSLPIIVVGGLLLLRMGRLLRRHVKADSGEGGQASYRSRVLSLIARGILVIGVLGPVLAAVGYVSAAAAMVYPAILSLGLIGFLFLMQQLVGDVFAAITRKDEASQQSLIPVLIGFGMTLFTIPVFALIWGARWSDLTELWTRFREGFQLGDARISPTDFLVFAVVFAAGYTLTRLFQGGLKSTILPKTTLDTGGQNAIVAGVGYTGIFLSALIAINSAGLDLSGLAIVAGALSVGIGFGLQTIVSNFVSGIILLIERPISEGDWIEVGTVQGIVKAISVRSTRIQTFDRNDVIVPNSDLITGRVTNWTRFNLTGRLIVPVSVIATADSREVEAILRDVVEAQPLAILNPAPLVVFMGFGTETMNFEIRVILRDVNFLISVRSDINHAIAQRLKAAGIDISVAAHDLRLRTEQAPVVLTKESPA
jgi:potassium-dependent mechanosensitive channel